MSQIYKSASGGGTNVEQLTGNSGVAVSSGNNINVVTANSTVKFIGSGSTLTQDFNLTNIILGSSGSTITTATGNAGLGTTIFLDLTTGSDNSFFGEASGQHITTGNLNSGFGGGALSQVTTGNYNTAVGAGALGFITSGSYNTAIGYLAGNGGSSFNGSYNTFIGYDADIDYTASESSNILIGNIGIGGDNNVIRIGEQGSGNSQQNTCYIAGIVGVSVSNQQFVTINSSTGQLGVTTQFGTNVTNITAASYQVLVSDDFIGVNRAGAVTVTLEAAPTMGREVTIKDISGAAGANNITISGNGNNIDGSSTRFINSNYGSVTLIFNNSTGWSII